jgi:hypothetical protein
MIGKETTFNIRLFYYELWSPEMNMFKSLCKIMDLSDTPLSLYTERF